MDAKSSQFRNVRPQRPQNSVKHLRWYFLRAYFGKSLIIEFWQSSWYATEVDSNTKQYTQLTFTCSKLIIETLRAWCEIWKWCHFGVYNVNFEQILALFLVLLFAGFEQVNTEFSNEFRGYKFRCFGQFLRNLLWKVVAFVARFSLVVFRIYLSLRKSYQIKNRSTYLNKSGIISWRLF